VHEEVVEDFDAAGEGATGLSARDAGRAGSELSNTKLATARRRARQPRSRTTVELGSTMSAGPLISSVNELLRTRGTSSHAPNHARADEGSPLSEPGSGIRSDIASIEAIRASTRTASIATLRADAANPKRFKCVAEKTDRTLSYDDAGTDKLVSLSPARSSSQCSTEMAASVE